MKKIFILVSSLFAQGIHALTFDPLQSSAKTVYLKPLVRTSAFSGEIPAKNFYIKIFEVERLNFQGFGVYINVIWLLALVLIILFTILFIRRKKRKNKH